MCRRRSGPRCSPSGRKRYDKAQQHLSLIQSRYDAELAENGRVSPRRARQLRNATRRLEAAKRVFYATPGGQRHLEGLIAERQEELAAFVAAGKGPRSKVVLDAEHNIENLEEERTLGIQRRKDSYADMHLTDRDRTNERGDIRNESRNRGGEMDSRAHPMSQQAKLDNLLSNSEPARLALKPWSAEDVARADSWVESGANPGWTENGRIRPAVSIDGVSVGTEKVVPSTSRLIRLNTPDGQVVESRKDFHLTKNADGKFVVSTREATASSFEDAAPIDVTTQELGHILSSNSDVSRKESKSLVGAYDTQLAGVRALNRAKREYDQTAPQHVALNARNAFIARANRPDNDLQQRGLPSWFRFQEGKESAA